MPTLSDDALLVESESDRYERERDEAEELIRATLRNLYVRYRGIGFQGGGILDMIVWWVEALRDEFDPRPALRKQRIPAALRKAVYERDAYRCVTCGGWKNLSVDHRIPESLGGETTLGNLQTMCRPCNLRKGTKT